MIARDSSLCVVACFLSLSTCSSHAAPEPEIGPSIIACTLYSCGSNSPELFGEPIRGLSVNGATNADRMMIERDSLKVRSQPGGSTCSSQAVRLGVQDGEFVGMKPDGTVLCRGKQLVGASITVRRLFLARTHTSHISIAEMDKVSTWEIDPNQRRYVATYRLVDDNHKSICTKRRVAWMDDWQINGLVPPLLPGPNSPGGPLGPPLQQQPRPPQMPPGIQGRLWFKVTDHAVIVQGEAYNDAGEISRKGAEWFNIGCAGNALAKMRLLGFNPMATGQTPADRGSTEQERVATLKMLTAKYAGPESHTVQGTALLWMSSRGIHYYGDPSGIDPRIGPIEAQWGPAGALCLSHLRLSKKPKSATTAQVAIIAADEVETIAALRSGGQPPACSPSGVSQIATSISNGSIGNAVWTTFTYEHVD